MSLQASTSQTVGPFFIIGCTWLNRNEIAGEGVAGERVTIEGARWWMAMANLCRGRSARDMAGKTHRGNTRTLMTRRTKWDRAEFSRIRQEFRRMTTGNFALLQSSPAPVPGPDGKAQAPHLAIVGVRARIAAPTGDANLFFRMGAEIHRRLCAESRGTRGGRWERRRVKKDRKALVVLEGNVVLQGDGETVFFDV